MTTPSMTITEFGQALRQHFGIRNSKPYLCPVEWMACRVHLDLLALDDWLHQQHGMYEDRHLSMATLITEEYGQAACDWTRRAAGLPP